MKIGLITTLDTNIGDDFIREGICRVLRKVFDGHLLEFVAVNKHTPYTVYPDWHPISWAPYGKRTLRRILPRFGFSKFDQCDLIVQCGAPVFWYGCHVNDWAEVLWDQVVARLYTRIPVMNLAAGSSYAWERQPDSFTEPRDAAYVRRILSYCVATTVRDQLSQKLCKTLDFHTPLLPCSALLAPQHHVRPRTDRDLILVNYMEGSGHYDFDQKIDVMAWRETVTTLINRLKSRHRLAFLCHDQKELSEASRLDSTLPAYCPQTMADYFALIAQARAGLCNRMHASVALAGLGIPSVAVCTDTRLLMVQQLGLPCFYVKDATTETLEAEIEHLLTAEANERARLLALETATYNDYMRIVRDICGQHALA